MHASDIEHAVASDISLSLPFVARRPRSRTFLTGRQSRSCARRPTDPGFSMAGPFDLVICNPPYIPRPGERHDNPYRGSRSHRQVPRRAARHSWPTTVVLLGSPTLAGERPLAWFDDYGWHLDMLERMRVPLKVERGDQRRHPGSARPGTSI